MFDNADDISFIENYWPRASRGSIIVTSRDAVMSAERTMCNILVPEFSVPESLEFFKLNLPGHLVSGAECDVREVCEILDGLPLALSQVTTFIRTRGCRVETFLKKFKDEHDSHHDVGTSNPLPGYSSTLSIVWQMSISALTPNARRMLDILVFLNPDSIQNELFQNGGDGKKGLRDGLQYMSNQYSYFEAVKSLRQQSLIRSNEEQNTVSIHRFLQEAAFRQIQKDVVKARQAFEDALELICNAQPEDNFKKHWSPQFWESTLEYLPHVKKLTTRFLQNPASFSGSEAKMATVLFNCAT